MTKQDREFAKSRIKYLLLADNCLDKHDRESLEMAIQALSQEPCEGAISREDAINIASLHCLTIDESVKALERLPSVTQKSETGHWIDTDEWCETVDGFEQWGYFRKCSKCGYVFKFLEIDNYCPNCGAKMESEANNG